jgi:hypothetical protein
VDYHFLEEYFKNEEMSIITMKYYYGEQVEKVSQTKSLKIINYVRLS